MRTFTLPQALARDGFRCMVTGHVDRATVLANRVLALGHRTRATTVCCHILPDSTTEGADPGNPDRALKVCYEVSGGAPEH